MKDAPVELLKKIQRRRFEIDREFVKECLHYRREIQLLDHRGQIISDWSDIRKDRPVVDARLTLLGRGRCLQNPSSRHNEAMSYAVKWPGKVLLVSTPTDVLSTLLEKHDTASGVLLSNGKIHLKVDGRNYVRTVEQCIEILLKKMPDVTITENGNNSGVSNNAQAVGSAPRVARSRKRVSV